LPITEGQGQRGKGGGKGSALVSRKGGKGSALVSRISSEKKTSEKPGQIPSWQSRVFNLKIRIERLIINLAWSDQEHNYEGLAFQAIAEFAGLHHSTVSRLIKEQDENTRNKG